MNRKKAGQRPGSRAPAEARPAEKAGVPAGEIQVPAEKAGVPAGEIQVPAEKAGVPAGLGLGACAGGERFYCFLKPNIGDGKALSVEVSKKTVGAGKSQKAGAESLIGKAEGSVGRGAFPVLTVSEDRAAEVGKGGADLVRPAGQQSDLQK